jgi:beta-glucosidase
MPLPVGATPLPIPADAIPGAGYVGGAARLGIPALKETDASLGVAYVFGLRRDGATALPSGLAMASTWNPALLEQGGAMIGAEARAKGFNVMLAGGVNLMRDPRNGRNFEYFGEDPLLSGTLAGHAIRGIQSNHIIATIKHFALNGQETGRKFVDPRISEGAARESDLLAFQLGIEIGNPGSVMCAYNKVNGDPACSSNWLLNTVLKRDWGYKGFVMSDWGAVPDLQAAMNGLDQQSGGQLDKAMFFDRPLAEAAADKPAWAARRDDMNRRVLWAIYDNGLDKFPVSPGGKIDFDAHGRIAQDTAEQGIVLLRNERGALPLAASAKRIAVIGGYADTGVVSGAGSSQVQGQGGPAVSIPLGGGSGFAAFIQEAYHRSVPLKAIKAQAGDATVTYRNGRYISEAVTQAKQADVAIVFATQWSTEGFDQPDLTLPNGQDALIAAVADANPNTIVVLETGGPVLMPWLGKTAAVVEAWYPGARGRKRSRTCCSARPTLQAACRSRSRPPKSSFRVPRSMGSTCSNRISPAIRRTRTWPLSPTTTSRGQTSVTAGSPARGKAAVPVRPWPVLHRVRHQRPQDRWRNRHVHGHQHRQARRRHGGAALYGHAGGRAKAASGGLRARRSGGRRLATGHGRDRSAPAGGLEERHMVHRRR